MEELLGKTMADLFPSELAKVMIESDLKVLCEQKPVEVIEKLDGRYYATLKFPIVREGKPPLLAGFTMDITDRKRAEESRERFSQIFDHGSNCIAITRMADGRFIDVNNAWMRAFGYTREQAIGKSGADLGMWKNPADRNTCMAELEDKGEIVDFETTFIKASGEGIYLMSGTPIEANGERCIMW